MLSFTLILIAVSGGITACSSLEKSEPVLRHDFDRKTGANVTSLSRPLVFYREKPWLAANARDYIYLGPIEVSQTGQRRYLLWLGIWSTIDQLGRPSRKVQDTFKTVYLVTDGEPMKLEISAWSGAELGMHNIVYSTPVSSADNAFYRVTKDQIRKIALAETIIILPGANTPSSAGYLPWREEKQPIAEFMSYLSGE